MVAPTDCTVLLQGETGTGKEVVAELIHNRSPRRDQALIKVNCAAIPGGLLESELFGHERGAFTGAMAQRLGRFELADKGTLFLDEVGDIPLELQPKLLRVLQEQQFERLGGTRTLQTHVRLIAATHRNLAQMVERRKVQSGSSLPPECFSYHPPAAARARRRYSFPGPPLHRQVCAASLISRSTPSRLRPWTVW